MSFQIDTNTVLLAFIASLMTTVAWFTRKWALGIESQLVGIHSDMKEHNDKSDAAHSGLNEKINRTDKKVAKIEGQLED